MKKWLIVMFVMAILVCGISGCEKNTINVEGDSEIQVNANEAEVVLGVSVIDDSASAAQEEAGKVMNSIIDGLITEGLAKEDMKTEQLSLYEEREWKEGSYNVIGWRATQTLRVKTTNMSGIGKIVDVSVENRANQISYISFGLSKDEEQKYKIQVLDEATKNAREKAEVIAESLDVKLGSIKSVSESQYYFYPYRYDMAESLGVAAVQEASSVMPGKVTVTAHISLVYTIS